jgi:hypothetical protein
MPAVQVDPTPIPADIYAKRMKTTADTLIKWHFDGVFPCLKQIGRKWFVLPVKVAMMSLEDGDEAAGREIPLDLDPPKDQEEDVQLRVDARGGGRPKRGRSRKSGSQPEEPDEWSNPLGGI